MGALKLQSLLLLASAGFGLSEPFLKPLSNSSWLIGNDLWNITIGPSYGKKLYYQNQDLIGNAVGHYSGYDGESNFQWTSAQIYRQAGEYTDIVFTASQLDFHWVLTPSLPGAYQYIVNKNLPSLGVLRSLFRLDNTTFTRGHTGTKDDILPPWSEFFESTKVQDETWERADGTYITKYDFSTFIRNQDFHGIYGDRFGSWYIRPGKDYFNGDHLKQELTVHRESATGDAVELNVVHGSHFQVTSTATFPAGKIWGPWLWYLNNGSVTEAAARAVQEAQSWPYAWLNDTAYQSRGAVAGRLTLSDGRAAAGAAVRLGDNNSTVSTLDQGENYYYTTYADAGGYFNFTNVRSGAYGLSAWSNGGSIDDVYTVYSQSNILVGAQETTNLNNLTWTVSSGKKIFQLGSVDRKTLGFHFGGAPYEHALVDKSPANLTFTVGSSEINEWYFAQGALGAWTVRFEVQEDEIVGRANGSATLWVALAGYSKGVSANVLVNGGVVGTLGSGLKNDPSVYRSGTTAGEWRLLSYDVDGGLVKKGWNELTFNVTETQQWKGFLWDAIVLEWT